MKSVIDFFCSVDISRQAPGKCDVVKIKLDDGSKIEKQNQHLEVSVIEAYNIWKSENASRKIGKSTFSSLRVICVINISVARECMCFLNIMRILLMQLMLYIKLNQPSLRPE